MWQTTQGHLLVEAHLNGRRAGWMILDTGASGFVIDPAVADQFRLPSFGNLRIAGSGWQGGWGDGWGGRAGGRQVAEVAARGGGGVGEGWLSS